MPNFPRTDLAVEAEAIHRSAAAVTELPGVRAEETNRRGFSVTEVHVLDAAGENALCKPIGDYYTLALDPLLRREDDAFENAAQTLAELLRGVLPLMPDASVLVVGLGNRAITPDAVGPDAIDSVMVTRHLREQLPELEILEYEPMRAHCSLPLYRHCAFFPKASKAYAWHLLRPSAFQESDSHKPLPYPLRLQEYPAVSQALHAVHCR